MSDDDPDTAVPTSEGPWELPGDLDATARKIVTAARIRFSENGFSETTMEDIAAQAGVGVATVYRRFRHRRRLVRYAIIDEAIRLADRILILRDGTFAVDVAIDDPHPRDRNDPGSLEHRRRLLAELGVVEVPRLEDTTAALATSA